MRPHFSPQRHGARYVLDDTDVVILSGTPALVSSYGSLDMRIRISQNRFAERALWVKTCKHIDEVGVSTEFHLWTYKLDERAVAEVRQCLNVLGHAGIALRNDLQESVRTLRFWHAGKETRISLSEHPADSLPLEQATLFELAWKAIESAVPVGNVERLGAILAGQA